MLPNYVVCNHRLKYQADRNILKLKKKLLEIATKSKFLNLFSGNALLSKLYFSVTEIVIYSLNIRIL